MVGRPLPPRHGRQLLHPAPLRPSRPGSSPDHHIPGHAHSLPQSDPPGFLVPAPVALHGDCRIRNRAVLRRHDRHHCHQRLPPRLLPRRLWRSQRMDHGEPQLVGFHVHVRPDRMGRAAPTGESVGHPGCYNLRFPFLGCFLAAVWKTHQAVARPHGIQSVEVSLTSVSIVRLEGLFFLLKWEGCLRFILGYM